MNGSNSRFLIFILALQAAVFISILFNIPYVRQVLGFIFFIFVPGYLILRIFRIEKPHATETIVISVGLSIAFLMLIGLFINELGSFNIFSHPLAIENLIPVIAIVLTIICIISYVSNKDHKGLDTKSLEKFWEFLPFLLIPVLSVIGVLSALYFQNNLFSIFVIILVAIVFVSSALRSKISSYYPLIIFMIVLALLLSSSLMSHYMYGDDIQGEFSTFLATKNLSFWNPQNYVTVQQSSDNSMLSITIFPTILSNLLNIDPDYIFKIVFLVIFSMVPLGLYELYRKQWNEKVAFISVIFFISNYSFFSLLLADTKQMIGLLFYVILFLELISKDLNIYNYKRNWIILVFALFGLVVSHYSLVFLFLILIFFTWFGKQIFYKKVVTKINGLFIVFTSCLVFFWYIYIVPVGPIGKFVGVIRTSLSSFIVEFFSPSSRGEDVQTALGIVARPSTLHYVGTILYEITILFIFIGFLILLVRWKRKEDLNKEYSLLVSVNIILLITALVVPRFAGFLEMGRLYEILLIFLSPLFVIGADSFFKFLLSIGKRKKPINLKDENRRSIYALILTLIILTAFFLFQTGVVYELTSDPNPSSFSISYYKMQNSSLLIHESDVFGAQWLSSYGNINHMPTYADTISVNHVLESYSNISIGMMFLLSNSTEITRSDGIINFVTPKLTGSSYIYLSQFNVMSGIVWWYQREGISYKITDLPIMNDTNSFVNRVYSNGESEIYFRNP